MVEASGGIAMGRPLVLALVTAGCAVAAAQACWYEVPDLASTSEDAALDSPVLIDASEGGAADADASPNDGSCNPNAPFGTPAPISELDTFLDERYPRLSPDERTIYFSAGSAQLFQIYSAKRAGLGSAFASAGAIAELTPDSGSDLSFSVTADGLRGFLGSTRWHDSLPNNASQLWVTERGSASAAFGPPSWENTTFGAMNGDYDPYAVGNGFYYASKGSPQAPINLASGSYNGGTWSGGYTNMTGLGSAATDLAPVVTTDQLRIYFASSRGLDGGTLPSAANVWTSTRPYATSPWEPPTVVAELVGFGNDPRPGWISPNGCRLYLSSNASGSVSGSDDLYVATRGK